MSKLDRQTDQASAIAPIKVVWRAFDDVDAASLKQKLRSAVLKAENRVPLDCRDVDGAPLELIEILLDENEFAKGLGRQITLSFASDELRHALRPGVHRRPTSFSGGAKTIDAATAAASSLNQRLATHTVAKNISLPAPMIVVPKLPPKKVMRWIKIGAIVLVSTVFVGGLEYYLIFTNDESINISQFIEKGVIVPTKTFEGGGMQAIVTPPP